VTVDDAGLVHAVWLDGRNAHGDDASPAPAGEHHMRQDIYQSLLRPDGTREEARVATDVCFCCKTAVVTAGAATYVAWRHVYPTNLRDIAVARSTDGGLTFSAPVRVSEDHWQIDACPEDGPSLAVTPDGTVHVVWPTLIKPAEDRKGIFYSFSTDGGRAFAPRMRLDRDEDRNRQAAHPQIAVTKGGLMVVWDETVEGGQRIRGRHIDATTAAGAPTFVPETGIFVSASDRERVRYPAIVGTSDGAVIAWASSGENVTGILVLKVR
jgi:hypothetical protein